MSMSMSMILRPGGWAWTKHFSGFSKMTFATFFVPPGMDMDTPFSFFEC